MSDCTLLVLVPRELISESVFVGYNAVTLHMTANIAVMTRENLKGV